ncbi:hypothetical protein [Okeania sp.]|nr:hypothetical protein [Okeania sp.]MEB3339771.1 hypothetical protein [Okeania sp.]
MGNTILIDSLFEGLELTAEQVLHKVLHKAEIPTTFPENVYTINNE